MLYNMFIVSTHVFMKLLPFVDFTEFFCVTYSLGPKHQERARCHDCHELSFLFHYSDLIQVTYKAGLPSLSISKETSWLV